MPASQAGRRRFDPGRPLQNPLKESRSSDALPEIRFFRAGSFVPARFVGKVPQDMLDKHTTAEFTLSFITQAVRFFAFLADTDHVLKSDYQLAVLKIDSGCFATGS